MLREYIIITYLLAIHARWDELREFFALNREFLANTTRLSPEDQANVDQAFKVAQSIVTKDDEALQK